MAYDYSSSSALGQHWPRPIDPSRKPGYTQKAIMSFDEYSFKKSHYFFARRVHARDPERYEQHFRTVLGEGSPLDFRDKDPLLLMNFLVSYFNNPRAYLTFSALAIDPESQCLTQLLTYERSPTDLQPTYFPYTVTSGSSVVPCVASTDRLYLDNPDKYDQHSMAVFGDTLDNWSDRSHEQVQEFLRRYFKDGSIVLQKKPGDPEAMDTDPPPPLGATKKKTQDTPEQQPVKYERPVLQADRTPSQLSVVFDTGKQGTNVLDTDYLYATDADGHDQHCIKVFGNTARDWSQREPETIELFLKSYLNEDHVVLTKLIEPGCVELEKKSWK